jgi:solute carrier family 39 (zinc transporter), member 1/2/3
VDLLLCCYAVAASAAQESIKIALSARIVSTLTEPRIVMSYNDTNPTDSSDASVTPSTYMDYSMQLRIASVFILFCVSLLGIVVPLIYASCYRGEDTLENQRKLSESDTFRIIRTFAAGVMLGVGFIHLLADGVSKLTEVNLEYPALGYTLATVGALIVLGFEQIAVMLISRIDTVNDSNDSIKSKASKDTTGFGLDPTVILEVMETDQPGATSKSCDHNHALKMIAGSDSLAAITKAYMMEISVAIHSVIIGITLGSLSGPDNLQSLEALIIAICFHQFFEGLGLGTIIEAARLDLGLKKTLIFALTFAITVPIGVAIGIVISNNQSLEDGPSVTQEYTTGCLNSVSAGIMIYVALVEMAAEDFQQASIMTNVGLKMKMFSALMLGLLCMAILAIWA